jgi:hypothetical protein
MGDLMLIHEGKGEPLMVMAQKGRQLVRKEELNLEKMLNVKI